MYGTYQKQYQFFSTAPATALHELEIKVEEGTGDKGLISVAHPITIVGFGMVVVNEVVNYDNASPTEAVWALDYRPIDDSDTGRVQLETITIPGNAALTSMAIGEVLYNKMAAQKGGYDCDPGSQLVLEVTTAGAGTTETGTLKPFIVYHDRGEYIDNLDNLVTIVEE